MSDHRLVAVNLLTDKLVLTLTQRVVFAHDLFWFAVYSACDRRWVADIWIGSSPAYLLGKTRFSHRDTVGGGTCWFTYSQICLHEPEQDSNRMHRGFDFVMPQHCHAKACKVALHGTQTPGCLWLNAFTCFLSAFTQFSPFVFASLEDLWSQITNLNLIDPFKQVEVPSSYLDVT